MIQEQILLLREQKLHHGIFAHAAYIRRCKFYFDDSLNRTMPEQGNRGHGYYSQMQVIHDVIAILRQSFLKMNAWDIEEQVCQAPTCALTATPTPTPIPTTAITLAMVQPIPTVISCST